MKVFIWVGCFLVFCILQVGYQHSGILLGAIPTALLAMAGFWLTWQIAKKLCKKWDQRTKRNVCEEVTIPYNEEHKEDSVTEVDNISTEEQPKESTVEENMPDVQRDSTSEDVIPTTETPQPNRKSVFTNKIILPIILSVLLFISIFCNIVFIFTANNYKDTAAEYYEQLQFYENNYSVGSESSSIKDSQSSSNSVIASLKKAIKKNPSKYINTQVTLKGTILKEGVEIILLDYHGSMYGVENRYEAMQQPSIKLTLKGDIKFSPLETGDYVEIKGTIIISNGEIYLDNCKCTIILTNDERR